MFAGDEHDCAETVTMISTTSSADLAELAGLTMTPSTKHEEECRPSGESYSDSDSARSEVLDHWQGRAACVTQAHSEKKARCWASALDLRAAIQAARPRLVEIPRSRQLTPRKSLARLVSIQRSPSEEGSSKDGDADQLPRNHPSPSERDTPTPVPGRVVLLS